MRVLRPWAFDMAVIHPRFVSGQNGALKKMQKRKINSVDVLLQDYLEQIVSNSWSNCAS